MCRCHGVIYMACMELGSWLYICDRVVVFLFDNKSMKSPKMLKAKLPLTKVVEVKWRDACTMGGWRAADHYLNPDPMPVTTVGYLLKDTKSAVTIVQSQSSDGDFNDCITVPKDWVVSIRTIRR